MTGFEHEQRVGAAITIREETTRLNKGIANALALGADVEILDHKGKWRPLKKVQLRISEKLVEVTE
jgi:hypothetical protein